jgi:hypothetical protein
MRLVCGKPGRQTSLRRFFVLILLPVLVLVAVIALGRAASGWHYVESAPPGDVMLVAAFDGLPEDWEGYDDGQLAASVDGGVLRLTVNAFQSLPYSLARPYFADFDLRVTARSVEGPLNNGFGVMFRMLDNDNFFMFQTSSDGYYRLVRSVDGVQKELSVWILSPIVNQGLDAVNDLRVIAQGNRFRFEVNGQSALLCIPDDPNAQSTYNDLSGECIGGQMLDTLIDDHLPAGRIGVVAQSFDEAGVVVEFDNVVVTAPIAQ